MHTLTDTHMHTLTDKHMHTLTDTHIETHTKHMWQSRIEIEYYSVAYFERITELDAL